MVGGMKVETDRIDVEKRQGRKYTRITYMEKETDWKTESERVGRKRGREIERETETETDRLTDRQRGRK